MVASLVIATVSAANAADQITIQLLWVTQAQFAGYYVAKDKGFYKDVDLAVTINRAVPVSTPSKLLLQAMQTSLSIG